MHVVARARLVLARRPWVYWTVVAALAFDPRRRRRCATQLARRARNDWGATRSVLVAERRLAPGDTVAARLVDLPLAAIPPGALDELPDGARLHQRVGDGEVVTELDITALPGPAGRATPGTVVVAMSDPLGRGVTIGLNVQVAADGLVLAESATVVEVVDDVIFVAVDASIAPTVAAAARQGVASLLYLP